MGKRIALLFAFVLALGRMTAAQTTSIPFTGEGLLPDGSKVAVRGSVTVTPPAPPPAPVPAFGPREPVGPDVPLSAAEQSAFTRRVSVSGFTGTAIQAAITQAVALGIPVVYLPAGTYTVASPINVGAGLTILGAGSGTLVKPSTPFVQIFYTKGDNVRYTRMKLVGPAAAVWMEAQTQITARAFEAWVVKNVRVDHCDISGFAYAVLFADGATGTMDTCRSHHNQVVGLGYGVDVHRGASALVRDCEFGDNRHCLASTGGGREPTNWQLVHNRFLYQARHANQREGVDTHNDFDGVFLVEANSFENIGTAVGISAGSGQIKANQFTNIDKAIMIRTYTNNGITGIPHDIAITGSVFVGTVLTNYEITPLALRVTVDGALVTPKASPPAAKPGKERKE